jgi:hypothetical protein
LAYNQIWLNLPKDDCHFFYKKKFFKKIGIHHTHDIQMFVWFAWNSKKNNIEDKLLIH